MRIDVPSSTIPGKDLGAFLFSRASLIFQLASHKRICLEVLRILILGQKASFLSGSQSAGSRWRLQDREQERSLLAPLAAAGASSLCPDPLLTELCLDKLVGLNWFWVCAFFS